MRANKILLLFILIFSSCVTDQGLRPGKTVSNQASSTGCGPDFIILPELNTCINKCEEGDHVASQEEIDASVGASPSEDVLERLNESAGACIADVIEITRPSEVILDKGFCACERGKPIMIGNCTSFCAGKPADGAATLFIKTTLGVTLQTNEIFNNKLFNWCNIAIDDGNVAPKCQVNMSTNEGPVEVLFELKESSNEFTVNIASLPNNKIYRLQLEEVSSGAKSDSIQFEKYPPAFEEDITRGAFKTVNLIQYTCVNRAGSGTSSGDLYNNSARTSFYFPSNNRPDALPPGNDFEFCHDLNLFGNRDSDLFPRLEEEVRLRLWNPNDGRFIDSDGDDLPDVNQTIREQLLNEHGLTFLGDIFGEFKWHKSPALPEAAPMGIFMVPWVDQLTQKGFCPTQSHYNSNDKLFNLLGELVGVDTEGAYFAKREHVQITDSEGKIIAAPDNIMIIREGLLKKIWFHYDRSTLKYFTPNDGTIENSDIYFYWPPDEINPFTRKGDSKLFTVRRATELGEGTQGSIGGLQTSARATDKRFGCIPKLTD